MKIKLENEFFDICIESKSSHETVYEAFELWVNAMTALGYCMDKFVLEKDCE